jgi:hypothetical protein
MKGMGIVGRDECVLQRGLRAHFCSCAHALASIVAMLLFATSAWAQDTSYLKNLPSAQDVEEKVVGSDADDTAARRAIAFEHLMQIAINASGTSMPSNDPKAASTIVREFTPREQALMTDYHNNYWRNIESIADRDKRVRLLAQYQGDATFRETLMTTLFEPRQRKALEQASRTVVTRNAALSQQAASGQVMVSTVPLVNQGFQWLLNIPPLFLLFMFGGLTLLFSVLDWMKFRVDWSRERPRIYVRGAYYDVYNRVGLVIQSGRAHVTSYTPGSTTVNTMGGHTTVNTTPGYTTETVKDQIFMVDAQGQEHALELSNWKVSVRPGHQLSALWLIKKGQKRGAYVGLRVHDINQNYDHEHILKQNFRASYWPVLLLTFGALVTFAVFQMQVQQAAWNGTTTFMGQTRSDAQLHDPLWLLGGASLLGLLFLKIARSSVKHTRYRNFTTHVAPRLYAEHAKRRETLLMSAGRADGPMITEG